MAVYCTNCYYFEERECTPERCTYISAYKRDYRSCLPIYLTPYIDNKDNNCKHFKKMSWWL